MLLSPLVYKRHKVEPDSCVWAMETAAAHVTPPIYTSAEALYSAPFHIGVLGNFTEQRPSVIKLGPDVRKRQLEHIKPGNVALVYDAHHIGVFVAGEDTLFDSMPHSNLSRRLAMTATRSSETVFADNMQILAENGCLCFSVVYCHLRQQGYDHVAAVSHLVQLSPFQVREAGLVLLRIIDQPIHY